MLTAAIPRKVPLPELGNYTDEVVFGNLGLPVGFDQERLLVNLRVINRVRAAAGLGIIAASTESPGTSPQDMAVLGLDGSGAATMGAVSKRQQQRLSRSDLTFPRPSSAFGRPDVKIRINKSEIQERIREKNGVEGEYSPKPVAKYLNAALKQGLESAIVDANFDMHKLHAAIPAYSATGILIALNSKLTGSDPAELALQTVVATPVLMSGTILFLAEIAHLQGKIDNPLELWKQFRKSLFFGPTPDRALAGAAMLNTARIISVQN